MFISLFYILNTQYSNDICVVTNYMWDEPTLTLSDMFLMQLPKVAETFMEETAMDDVLEMLRVCRFFALWIHKLS